jgi:hypothetical protein
MTRIAAILCLLGVFCLTSCEAMWLSAYRHKGGGYGAKQSTSVP